MTIDELQSEVDVELAAFWPLITATLSLCWSEGQRHIHTPRVFDGELPPQAGARKKPTDLFRKHGKQLSWGDFANKSRNLGLLQSKLFLSDPKINSLWYGHRGLKAAYMVMTITDGTVTKVKSVVHDDGQVPGWADHFGHDWEVAEDPV